MTPTVRRYAEQKAARYGQQGGIAKKPGLLASRPRCPECGSLCRPGTPCKRCAKRVACTCPLCRHVAMFGMLCESCADSGSQVRWHEAGCDRNSVGVYHFWHGDTRSTPRGKWRRIDVIKRSGPAQTNIDVTVDGQRITPTIGPCGTRWLLA
jgi:hypothetical protein